MAHKRQHKQENPPSASAPGPKGGGQTVVELCEVTQGGIVFWSRQRFDVAAELQLRIRFEALSTFCLHAVQADSDGWATIRGFVVQCTAVRRERGDVCFRVSLVLDVTLTKEKRKLPSWDALAGQGDGTTSRQIFGHN